MKTSSSKKSQCELTVVNLIISTGQSLQNIRASCWLIFDSKNQNLSLIRNNLIITKTKKIKIVLLGNFLSAKNHSKFQKRYVYMNFNQLYYLIY